MPGLPGLAGVPGQVAYQIRAAADAKDLLDLLAFRATAAIMGFPSTPAIEVIAKARFDRFIQQETVAALYADDPAEHEFFTGILRSGAPGLIADLAGAEQAAAEDGGLSPVECIAMIRGVWQAGTDTTGATAATLLGLLSDPSYQDITRRALALTGNAQDDWLTGCVQETARLHPSFPQIPLRTYEDVTLPCGVVIPRASQVFIVVTAVNRDPQLAGDRPAEFLPGRRPGRCCRGTRPDQGARARRRRVESPRRPGHLHRAYRPGVRLLIAETGSTG